MTQKIIIRGPQAGLRRRELEGMRAQALKERSHCLDVSVRVGVEDHHTAEVGHHLFQALCNVVDYLDEPPGRGAAALRHDQLLIEARAYARYSDGTKKNRSNRENIRPLPNESRTWSTLGMGNWPRLLIRWKFL